jgi:DNA-binding transcriptional ArsR family regulator
MSVDDFPDTPAGGPVSPDRIFRAVADPLRRQLLDVLVTRDGRCVDRRTVVSTLAAGREQTEAEIDTALRHHHVPTLEAAGLVERGATSETLCCRLCALVDRLLKIAEQVGNAPRFR